MREPRGTVGGVGARSWCGPEWGVGTTEGLLCVSPVLVLCIHPREIALSIPVGLSPGTSIARPRVVYPALPWITGSRREAVG